MKKVLVKYLSKHIFWDVDSTTMDEIKHSRFIISRALLYGLYSDWQKIHNYYGLNKVVDVAIDLKELDKKTATFLALLSGKTKNIFKCYTTEQSTPIHWYF